MYYLSAPRCLLVGTFLGGLIFDACNPINTTLSAYGWILQESGPYPHMEQTGTSKAELLIEALEVYLNRLESDGGAEVAALRQQVMELEARFTALEEAVIGDVGQPLAVVEMPRVRKVAALQYGQS